MPDRLITIPVSHYCEKARWALDLADVAYDEDGWPPALHRIPIMRLRATRVPVLVTADGAVLRESGEIVAYADARRGLGLYGESAGQRAEIETLMRRFDTVLGPQVRLLVYATTLDDPARFLRLLAAGLPPRRAALLTRTRSLVTRVIRRFFAIDAATAESASARVQEELAFADARRGDSPYLVGGRFSAADLTFAALGAPLVSPPGYGVPIPDSETVRAEHDQWRATPSGAAILKLYRHHRSRRTTPLEEQQP